MSGDRGIGAGRGALFALVLLAACLRLIPIDHGDGRNYVPDTHVVRGALGMAKDRDPVPPVGRYSTYPNGMPYALLPIYAAQYGVGRATGAWGGSGEFRNHVALRPATVHLPARVLVALMGALTTWAVFRATRAAGLRRGAWIAAWFTATGLLHTQFSVQERPWVPVVLFIALAAWPAAVHVRSGSRGALILSGVCAALAASCHQAGAPALGIGGLAWLLGPRGFGGRELVPRVRDGALCVAVFLVVALVVGHPYLLVHGLNGAEHVAAADQLADCGPSISLGGQGMRFEVRGESFTRLGRALFGYEPGLLVLGLLGLPLVLVRRAFLPAVLFGLGWAALFLTNQNDHVRYLLPLVVLLAWPAGAAAERLLARRGGLLVLGPVLVLALVQDLRLVQLLGAPDSRAIGEEHLAELPDGARVAIDRFGPLADLDAVSLERLSGWRSHTTREQVRLEILEGGDEARAAWDVAEGIDGVRLEDLFAFDDRARTFRLRTEAATALRLPEDAGFGAVFEQLGVTHVLEVDRGGGRPNPLGAWLREHGAREVEAIDPAGDAGADAERMLPLELDFALTGLWAVGSCGPRLVLWELR